MTQFIDARDFRTHSLRATLPAVMFPWAKAPLKGDVVMRLRWAFVQAGMLNPDESDAVVFEVRGNRYRPKLGPMA